MTHAHFDHVGALGELADRWDVPVYAHPLEMPYLNARASYPPADPAVCGELPIKLSMFFPTAPVNVAGSLRALPESETIPEMPGWRWLHTPGHTPGHISLWRASDRTLLAGDAFITCDLDSAFVALALREEVRGPPQFMTQNWPQAETSVFRLEMLEPELAVTSHGHPMRGDTLRAALHALTRDFERLTVPKQGRHVGRAARDAPDASYLRAQP